MTSFRPPNCFSEHEICFQILILDLFYLPIPLLDPGLNADADPCPADQNQCGSTTLPECLFLDDPLCRRFCFNVTYKYCISESFLRSGPHSFARKAILVSVTN